MKTVKLSYTILNAWAMGRQEDAVGMYLGKELPKTDAMELGWLYHKKFENESKATKSLPEVLGGDRLINPLIEQKCERLLDFSDDYKILIRGVLDVEDVTLGIDYKVGRSKASSYNNSMQHTVYKVLRPHLTKFMYICFNPYLKEVERSLVYLTDETLYNGLNFIYTYAGEIIGYLESQKMLIDYKEKV